MRGDAGGCGRGMRGEILGITITGMLGMPGDGRATWQRVRAASRERREALGISA